MIKVLIIDDSVVFRTQISSALRGVSDIDIVGTAASGSIALSKLDSHPEIDVVTLDMEMPDMNGIDVLKEIRRRKLKTKVIVFSSQTQKGAEKALEALSAGADDVVAKPSAKDHIDPSITIRDALAPKILQFSKETPISSTSSALNKVVSVEKNKKAYPISLIHFKPKIVVIASSTGGPSALEEIFKQIKGPLRIPILIAQHMPPVFTEILAKRIANLNGIPCKEAVNGEPLINGFIYVAPGDYHMEIDGVEGEYKIKLHQQPQRNSVRPAADYLFESAAQKFKAKSVGVVLTGMGEDGKVGSQAIKECMGGILIQNKESCVVFGMPGSVYNDGCFDEQGNLEHIAQRINSWTK